MKQLNIRTLSTALLLLGAVILPVSASAQSDGGDFNASDTQQVNKRRAKKVIVYLEATPLLQWNTNGNLSPSGFQNQAGYQNIRPGVQLNLLLGRNDSYRGLRYHRIGYATSAGAETYGAGIDYVGLVSGLESSLWSKHLSISLEGTLGYVHLSNRIRSSLTGDKARVVAHGFGYGIGVVLRRDLDDARGIGFRIGADVYTTFKWRGDETYINDLSYTGKTFGAKSNTGIYPYIGLSFYLY